MVVRRLARALRARSRRSDTLSESGFDPAFYRETYPDLAQVPNDEQLARHYLTFGRTEGRMGSRAQADAALDALGTQLPPGFDVCDYLACNPDLSAALTPDWRAAEHYLRHGRLENRPVFALDTALYAELYFPGQALSAAQLREHYAQTGQAEGRVGSIAAFARAHGVPGCGRWIAAIRPREFAVLNWTWAGEVRSRADAVRAMLREGLGRLAPIAFGLTFDPFYFREATGALVGVDDVDLYRDWLFHGLDRDQPGSERQHLRALGLPLSRYPVGFDWRRHAGAHALPEQRWAALDHLVRIGAATGAEVPILEPGGSAFLEALAQALPPEADAASLDLLQRAGRLAALGPGARRRLAQAHMRLDRYPHALEAYRALAQTPQAEVKSFGEGARAAVRSGNPEAGLALLAAGRDRFGGHQAFRAAARATIEAAFDAEAAAARELYTTGSRDAADAALTAAALKAQSRWSALDPVGAPIGPAAGGRVVVLANTDLRQCTHYRVEQKARLLQACGREHEIFSAADVDLFMGALPGAAAAIFYRLAATPANLRAIEYAAAMGVPTYYEIDDLIFAEPYPDPFETYGGSISRELYNGLLAGAPLFRLAMSRCEYGIASTTALARAMAPLVRTGEVFVLPNGLDDRNVGFDAAAQRRVRQDDDVLLFYGSGTKAHNSDFLDLAGPAIADILAARADVRLMVVGHLTLDARLEAHRDRITTVPFLPDARAFWSLLAEADINLAVLAPGVVAEAKSEIKWLEAAVMGIPSVVSDTDRHREVLEDGVDVLLARDADGWRSALQRLIDDPPLRRRLGETARAKALADYSVEANAPRLQALLGPADVRAETARTEAARPERRRRVLLVNVFFPPQTIGGATRVVRDNLDHFLDSPAASGLAFAVACTDHEAAPAYQRRVDAYRDCPVFRVSTPWTESIEWTAMDPLMGESFAEVLASWRPDLVHFHSVQRLTGSAVEACAAAGVPYLVTAHDAWWVSDYQFLIDEQDRLRAAGEPVPFDPPPPASVGDALARRRYLATLLDGAEAVLPVSQSFANLYRASGVRRVRAVPNGVPPLAVEPRVPSPSGRVRLAHVGGLTAHKGWHLLQAALREARYANLELTLVDHTGVGGETRDEVWGATPVRIVGKTPQEAMGAFYAAHDVLVAPSIWPESFGLVAREALAAGLRVIASDLGAMGEDIVPGVNGWVIDVATPAALLAVLGEIDAAPARYLDSPPPTTLRTAAEQAEELLALYDEILSGARAGAPPPSPLGWAGQSADPEAPVTLAAFRRRRMREREQARRTSAGG